MDLLLNKKFQMAMAIVGIIIVITAGYIISEIDVVALAEVVAIVIVAYWIFRD